MVCYGANFAVQKNLKNRKYKCKMNEVAFHVACSHASQQAQSCHVYAVICQSHRLSPVYTRNLV